MDVIDDQPILVFYAKDFVVIAGRLIFTGPAPQDWQHPSELHGQLVHVIHAGEQHVYQIRGVEQRAHREAILKGEPMGLVVHEVVTTEGPVSTESTALRDLTAEEIDRYAEDAAKDLVDTVSTEDLASLCAMARRALAESLITGSYSEDGVLKWVKIERAIFKREDDPLPAPPEVK